MIRTISSHAFALVVAASTSTVLLTPALTA